MSKTIYDLLECEAVEAWRCKPAVCGDCGRASFAITPTKPNIERAKLLYEEQLDNSGWRLYRDRILCPRCLAIAKKGSV